MSWLFGKKKHQKDYPTEDASEVQQLDVQERSTDIQGFTIIEKRPTMAEERTPYPSGGIYPFLGDTPMYPSTIPSNLPTQSQEVSHYLSGVPFKLCKQLQNSINNDLDTDDLRVSEIMIFIERIENENYDYDFYLEEGVITEMNSASAE